MINKFRPSLVAASAVLLFCSASTLLLLHEGVSAQRGGCLKLWTVNQNTNGRNRLSLVNARNSTEADHDLSLLFRQGEPGISGLAWSLSDKIMYGLQNENTLIRLSLQDNNNAQSRSVAGGGSRNSGQEKLTGLAAADTTDGSTLYTYQNKNENTLFRFDKENGNVIRVFDTGIGNNDIVDLAYSSHRNLLYATDGRNMYTFTVDGTERVDHLGTVTFDDADNNVFSDTRLAGIMFNRRGRLFGITNESSDARIYTINDSLRATLKSTSGLPGTVVGGATFECRKEDVPANACRSGGFGAGGRYYYTHWSNGRRVGFVDVENGSTNRNVSVSGCNLLYLAFDGRGRALGQCTGTPRQLVDVDLHQGTVSLLANFPPPPDEYRGFAYNPVDGHFYTTVDHGDRTFSLVRIERNYTQFTNIGSFLGRTYHGFAINGDGNAFAVDGFSPPRLYSVDLSAGTERFVGMLPFFSTSIAFYGPTLYGIRYNNNTNGPLFTIDVEGDTITTTIIKDTNAVRTVGGAFCPV